MTAAPDATERPLQGKRDASGVTGLAAVQEALANRPLATAQTSGAALAENQPLVRGDIRVDFASVRMLSDADANQPVTRGDVRIIEPLPWLEGPSRLVIVRRVDAEHDSADMMLVHPWPELATDTDAVIDSRDSDLPHPLVVECYVRGPVWLLQVRERVGFLPESVLQAIGAAVVDGQPEVDGAQAGLPLAGPADPRWRFKEDEVLEWSILTDDCASALLAGDDPWQLEPERLQPHTYERASDPATSVPDHLRLEETVHLLATRDVTLEFHDLDPETFDPDHWAECLGRDQGLTAYAAFQPTLLNALSHAGAQVLQKAA